MKKPFFSFLMTLVFLPLFWDEAFGWGIESIYKDLVGRQNKIYSGYDFPPVDEWFGKDRLKRFNDHLKKGACASAIFEMKLGFKRRYPSGPDPTGSVEESFSFSADVLPKHYPDLLLCDAIEKMELYQAEIDRRALVTMRLPQYRDSETYFAMKDVQRYHSIALGEIVLLSIWDYAPAHLKLAQLSEIGKVIKLTPEYLYYCLRRARMNGLVSPELDRLLMQAKLALGEKQRERIERRAKNGAWPRAEPLVVDGQRAEPRVMDGNRASWTRWIGIILNILGLYIPSLTAR